MTRFFLVLLLLVPTSIFSQTFSTSLDVPALTSGPARPTTGGQPVIRFDRRILVEAVGEPRGEFYLYLNTRTGDMGIRYGRSGELGNGELNINDPKFRFMVIRSGGQVLSYMTQEKNGALKHWVSTGNTEVFPISMPAMERTVIQRIGGSEPYVREGTTGNAYRGGSSAPTYYLSGRTEPREMTTQDFLGYSGVGYLKSNRGIYMVLGADMGAMRFHAVSWREMTTELDLSPFESMESFMNDKIIAGLDRQEAKVRNDSPRGDCASEEEEWNRLKLADIEERRRRNIERNRGGNVYENEPVRKAQAEMMMPNLEVFDQEMDVKICKANERLNRTRGEEQRQSIQERIRCYQNTKFELNRLQMEWDAIDARYPNEAGRAYAEKTRTYGRLMSMAAGCR